MTSSGRNVLPGGASARQELDAVVAPSREDPVVGGAANLVGGPAGRRVIPAGRSWLLLALGLLTLLTCALAYAQKLPCRDPGHWQHEYQYTRLCYSDVVALYYSEGLVGERDPATGTGARINVPYADHKVEYPVVIGGLMWLAAEGANAIHPDDPHLPRAADGVVPPGAAAVDARPETFYDLTALLLVAAAVVVVLATAGTNRRRPWDAALFALAPALIFHAFTNWDLAAAAFAALALLAWSRSHPWLAGAFLGLGTATKLYPLLFLVPLFVLCLRSRRMRSWFVAVFFGALAWAAVNVPVMVAHYDAWKTFYVLNRTRGPDFDSWWYMAQQVWGFSFLTDVGSLNIAVAVAVGLGILGVCALIWWAPQRPRLPQVLFLALAAFLLLNKVYSPQYVIWLIPLAALARPRWRGFLVWQATEIGLLAARYFFFVHQDYLANHPGTRDIAEGISYGWFQSAVLLRDAALIYLMVAVVYEILRPERDVVRRYGDDDPAGGVLDAAPDRRARRTDPYVPAVSVPA